MNTKQEILNFLATHKPLLQKKFHLSKIALFGSFARDEASLESDVDILIELDDNAKNIYELKCELRNFLSKNFQRDVDIAREKYLKSYAKKTILKDALYV